MSKQVKLPWLCRIGHRWRIVHTAPHRTLRLLGDMQRFGRPLIEVSWQCKRCGYYTKSLTPESNLPRLMGLKGRR